MQRALLFDFDGLIIDTETALARVLIDVFAQDHVHIVIEDIGHLFGSTGDDNDRAWDDFLAKLFGPGYNVADLEARILPLLDASLLELEVLPGVAGLMKAARDLGWRLGLGTGTVRKILLPRLERHGLADAFDEIVTSEDVERGKPAPDIWIELARRLGVPADGCIVIEDSPHGAQAALEADMAVVVCPNDTTRACIFADGIQIVQTLEELNVEVLTELLTRASVRLRR